MSRFKVRIGLLVVPLILGWSITFASNISAQTKHDSDVTLSSLRIFKYIHTKGVDMEIKGNTICFFDTNISELSYRLLVGLVNKPGFVEWAERLNKAEPGYNVNNRWNHKKLSSGPELDKSIQSGGCRFVLGETSAINSINTILNANFSVSQPYTGRVSVAVLGPSSEIEEAKFNYAKRNGYASWDEVLFSVNVDGAEGSQHTVKRLTPFNIHNLKDYSDAVSRMNMMEYSQEINPKSVKLEEFLKDEQDAVSSKSTAVAIKQERYTRELAAKQAKEAKDEEERSARLEAMYREYPFEAVLSCGMGGANQHLNIYACFAKSSYGADTELKIKNGNDVKMYKVYNLGDAGVERRDGFHINLKDSSGVIAQNSSNQLILSLKVYDRRAGKLIYNDAASQYQVLSFKAN